MTSQICKNADCEQVNPQSLENFRIYKKKYKVSECKECEKKRARENRKRKYASSEKRLILKQNKRYRDENKESLSKKQNERYANNPELREKVKENTKKWRANNPHKNREQHAAQYQNNKQKIQSKWNERYRNDPAFKLRNNLRKAIHEALRSNGGNKKGRSILQHLPYTMDELKSHLEAQWESWMNWDNYGPLRIGHRTWQIDHIVPQVNLSYSDFSDPNFTKCWTLFNLRPLESGANVLKGARILAC